MERVSGFLADDGKFFKTEEECESYNRELRATQLIEERIFNIRDGSFDHLPAEIAETMDALISDPEFKDWAPGFLRIFGFGLEYAEATPSLDEITYPISLISAIIDYVVDGETAAKEGESH